MIPDETPTDAVQWIKLLAAGLYLLFALLFLGLGEVLAVPDGLFHAGAVAALALAGALFLSWGVLEWQRYRHNRRTVDEGADAA